MIRHKKLTTLPDINNELDELEREEFYRLKKVQDKKQRDAAALDAEMAATKAAQAALEAEEGLTASALSAPEDLTADHDEDIIF